MCLCVCACLSVRLSRVACLPACQSFSNLNLSYYYVLQKKAWLNFREFGPAGSEDMIVNKSGDVVKIVEPIKLTWHLHDLSPSCNRRCVRTWLRCYFNVIVLAANEKARPKFSSDYINDIEKWPRTPWKLGQDPKGALAIEMCQDVIKMYESQSPSQFQLPDAVPIAKATYLAAKATLAAARSDGATILYEDTEDKEPVPDPDPVEEDSESSSDEDTVQLAGGRRRRQRLDPPPGGVIGGTSHPEHAGGQSDAGLQGMQRSRLRPAGQSLAAGAAELHAGSSSGSHTQPDMIRHARSSPNHPEQLRLNWAARKRMHDATERAIKKEDLAWRQEHGVGGRTLQKTRRDGF